MSNSTTNLDLISASQSQKEVTANSLFDAASPAMLFGRRASTTAALTWGYYGGSVTVGGTPTAIANGTITLAASATNYVEATSAGVVSSNTSGFTSGRTPLYTVITGAASVTSYTDHRTLGSGGGSGVQSVNGHSGTVTLTAADVGADESGTAAAAVSAHEAAVDPHPQYLDLTADTDTTLAANSDTRVATQKAVKAYVDGIATGGATDVMIFKGVIDCSANPNYPAADAGNLYKVSVAGKIGGGSGPNVEVGDTIYCITDGSGAGTHASVGANWVISQVNVDGAVIGPASATDGHFAQFDGSTGKLIKGGLSLDTDTTLAANSDTRVPSQKAIKAYVDSLGGGGGTPGGSTTQIQFNDAGAFGGDSDFTWDKTTNTLIIGSTGTPATMKGGAGSATANGAALALQGGTGGATSGDGGAATVAGGAATTYGAGGALNLNGGDAVGTGAVSAKDGGAVNITAGAGSNTTSKGNSGAVNITGGAGPGNGGVVVVAGGASTSSSYTGGAVSITGGASPNQPGSVSVTGGAANGSTNGGNVTITGGAANTSGFFGGTVTLKAGASNGSGAGQLALVQGGTGGATGAGGNAKLLGGSGGATSGNGGDAQVYGGVPQTSGNGGGVSITAAAGVGTNKNGGVVALLGGNATGSGVGGNITITAGDGAAANNGSVTIKGGLSTTFLSAAAQITLGPQHVAITAANGIAAGVGGGNASLSGGSGGTSNSNGGAVTISGGTAGSASNGPTGGAVTIQGGDPAALAGSGGGVVTIKGGAGSTTGTGSAGKSVTVQGGNAGGSGNNAGGSVVLTPGTATGTGAPGYVNLNGSGAALATTATGGHTCIPTCAGTPTGVPANIPTGTVPIVFDTTGSKLWIYTGGAWKSATFA